MSEFLQKWAESANTSLGFFWMALWAFSFGYFVSSMIQVFVTEQRMQKTIGGNSIKDIALGSFFGFISSSCSFSALATTKSLFKKGAGFVPSIAFLLASTNLVIELGIVISIFLGWQFVVGEYLGGILLILISWLIIRIIRPSKLISKAREKLKGTEKSDNEDLDEQWLKKMGKEKNWAKVAKQYGMEWNMVWKDVTIGFTIAGIVAAFVPDSFFEALFINTGNGNTDFTFLELLEHVLVGPLAAFMTFIGSMGNIPLAALLYGKGVSFAGVMAFIFSDLVVFPVLRINAIYYGWKMSLFILFLLFSSLILTALLLQYSFGFLDILPSGGFNIQEMEYFKLDYSFYLNIIFLILSAYLVWLGYSKYKEMHYMKEMSPKSELLEKTLKYIAFISIFWLIGGNVLYLFQ